MYLSSFSHAVPGTDDSIRFLKKKDIKEASRVIDIGFHGFHIPTEPTVSFLGVSSDIHMKYLIPRISEEVDHNLSFVAVENKTNKIIGVSICGDFGSVISREYIESEELKKVKDESEVFRIVEDLFQKLGVFFP